MLFGLVFQFLVQVALLFRLVVYEFHYIKLFDVSLFISKLFIFENSCVHLLQFDFVSKGRTENHFWAAPSSVVWIKAVRLCIQF